jgi:hypothetical protein
MVCCVRVQCAYACDLVESSGECNSGVIDLTITKQSLREMTEQDLSVSAKRRPAEAQAASGGGQI